MSERCTFLFYYFFKRKFLVAIEINPTGAGENYYYNRSNVKLKITNTIIINRNLT